jgi:hypothetical protein
MSNRDEMVTMVACTSRPMSPGPPLASSAGGPGPDDHGRHGVHGAPGGAAPAAVTAITAPAKNTSGSGGGRGEAIRTIYNYDRQLPPGHDPGADSGEAPNGRQRGSRPLNILVECLGHLRPRREVRTRHEDPAIVTLSATVKALAPPDERTGGPKSDGHGRHGGRGEA